MGEALAGGHDAAAFRSLAAGGSSP
jgi:hypothetical protein